MLGVHVVNQGRVGIPSLDNCECDGIEKVDGTIVCCGANVAAAPHDSILVFSWNLQVMLDRRIKSERITTDLFDDITLNEVNNKHCIL